MPLNKRKHGRIPIRGGSMPPAKMTLYKPFYREPFEVQIQDLSAGGMKILSPEVLPLYFDFGLEFHIAEVDLISAKGKAVHQLRTDGGYDVGIIFTELSEAAQSVLNGMGQDHLACEERIRRQERSLCRQDCRFLQLCRKPQKVY